jgi:esterase/lipase superfamily enzyme
VIEPTAPPPALVDAPQPVATARTPAPPRGGAVVTVLLATDRVRDGDRYGTARHDDLGLAVAEVRMPVDGSDGRIEIVRLTAASQPEAIAAARDKLALSERYPDHALVVVHGYATAVETAVVRAAQLAHDLAFDGAVVVYSWASAAAPARYADDVAAARATTAQLARALALVGGETGARTTSVIAIGLGARPVLDAVAALPARAGVDGHVLLLAPDVAVPALTAVATTRTDVARRITVYASARDRGLEVTRRHAGATPRAGDVTDAGPPLIPAVRTVDLTAVPVDPLSTAVPVAVDQRALVAHLAAVLASPPPPNPQPTAPTAGLDRITTPAGVYWRHPEAGAGR